MLHYMRFMSAWETLMSTDVASARRRLLQLCIYTVFADSTQARPLDVSHRVTAHQLHASFEVVIQQLNGEFNSSLSVVLHR